MTEEPYRWLEAVENRREYVREQLKGGSPAFAVRLPEGILLLAVGTGNSKVFELFDRHALAALGHPADIEKIRQAAIDAAHMEAFTRAPEDVTLRRLISFGISPQLKTNFEQIFSAPFLVEMLMAELGSAPEKDLVIRLHFDGSFEFKTHKVTVATSQPELETSVQEWLNAELQTASEIPVIVEKLMQAWGSILQNKTLSETTEESRREGWRKELKENARQVEIALLSRKQEQAAKYVPLDFANLGLGSEATA
ncbi:MAG: 20S proteasome subunit A/B [Verrucomicrobiales bacterium]